MTYITPDPRPSGGQLLSPDRATTLRRQADHTRADALLQVATGRASVWDVLRWASTTAGTPLLRLSLRQLLLAQPGVGPRTQELRLQTLFRTAGLPIGTSAKHDVSPLHPVTIQWLIDPRANGHRMLAFIDMMDTRSGHAPWPGFPFRLPISTDMDVQGVLS